MSGHIWLELAEFGKALKEKTSYFTVHKAVLHDSKAGLVKQALLCSTNGSIDTLRNNVLASRVFPQDRRNAVSVLQAARNAVIK